MTEYAVPSPDPLGERDTGVKHLSQLSPEIPKEDQRRICAPVATYMALTRHAKAFLVPEWDSFYEDLKDTPEVKDANRDWRWSALMAAARDYGVSSHPFDVNRDSHDVARMIEAGYLFTEEEVEAFLEVQQLPLVGVEGEEDLLSMAFAREASVIISVGPEFSTNRRNHAVLATAQSGTGADRMVWVNDPVLDGPDYFAASHIAEYANGWGIVTWSAQDETAELLQ